MNVSVKNNDFDFSKYTLDTKIGAGKFGEVWVCRNNIFRRKEAIKRIRLDTSGNLQTQARLNLLEPRVLEYLKKSDYIVKVFDAGLNKELNEIFITMEYLPKGSVNNLLAKHGYLDIQTVLNIMKSLLKGLEYAHNLKILHLDIKPSNILIVNKNKYKLSDFGLFSIKRENGSADVDIIYDLHIPPEIFKARKASEQTDIYLAGITFYRLVNGDIVLRKQFDEWIKKGKYKYAVLNSKYPSRNIYRYHVPSCVRKIIKKAINVDPKKRYKDAAQMRRDIEKIKLDYDWRKSRDDDRLIVWNAHSDNKNNLKLICEKKINLLEQFWTIKLLKVNEKSGKENMVHEFSKDYVKERVLVKRLCEIFNNYF